MNKADLKDHFQAVVRSKKESMLKRFIADRTDKWTAIAASLITDDMKKQSALASSLIDALEAYNAAVPNSRQTGFYDSSKVDNTADPVTRVANNIAEAVRHYNRNNDFHSTHKLLFGFEAIIGSMIDELKALREQTIQLDELHRNIEAIIGGASTGKVAYKRLEAAGVDMPQLTGVANLPAIINLQNLHLLQEVSNEAV